MIAAVTLLCPALVFYGSAPRLWVSAVAIVFVGLFYGYSFTSFMGVAQQSAPDEMRGRVLAVNSFVLGILFPVGTLLQGQLADRAGLRWTTAGSGVLLLAVLGITQLKRGHVGSPSWQTEPALPST